MKIVLEHVQQMCQEEFEKVKKNPYYFEETLYQSEEMCLYAVQKVPESLRYVEHQTKEICLEAVKSDASAIQYVNPCLLGEVLNELNLFYLPRGYYNPYLIIQRQEDGNCLVFNSNSPLIPSCAMPLKEYVEKLVPEEIKEGDVYQDYTERYNLNIQIQLQFLKDEGLI